MNYEQAVKQECQNEKAQKATKYSDADIKQVIEGAITCKAEYAPANALTALAMVAYNNMIDKRWDK